MPKNKRVNKKMKGKEIGPVEKNCYVTVILLIVVEDMSGKMEKHKICDNKFKF